MTAPIATVPARPIQNIEQTFPKLTSAQIARISSHGRRRRVEKGEVLIAVGKTIPFDGDWRKAKISEQEYTKIYQSHDEAYSQMLQALIDTLKKSS